MSNQYEKLPVVKLREIVKERGLKHTSALRKQQLVELLLAEDEKAAKQQADSAAREQTVPAVTEQAVTAAKEQTAPAKKPKAVPAAKEQTVPAAKQKAFPASRGQAPSARENRPVRDTGENHPAGDTKESQQVNRGNRNHTNNRTRSSAAHANNTMQNNASRMNNAQNRGGRMNNNPGGNTAGRGRQQQGMRSYRRQDGSQDAEKENAGFNQLDSGHIANGILEVLPDGYGFIRCANYLPGDDDVYVSPAQIRRFNLKTGDIVSGNIRVKTDNEKFSALLFVRTVNGMSPEEAKKRGNFEDMIPIFPDQKINLETNSSPISMRIMNLLAPIGKGQRGMIVAPPKTGKTTLLKQVARAIHTNYPDMNMIILLIDERPEEVTDMKEYIEGDNVEVIYSTFDELPEHHERVSEMVLERAKRLVEHRKDIVILLDSITRLARACNLTVQPSGRTLTGGLDPAALYMPKRFFGSARNMRGGGSLTVLATALVETGSKMDDVVFEEFKGTGNMELVLDRRYSDRRIFPAINIPKSGTRREDKLLTKEEMEASYAMRRLFNGPRQDEAFERVLDMFRRTKDNEELIARIKGQR